MNGDKYIKHEVKRREIHHTIVTLQNSDIPELKGKHISFTGGIMIEEISVPSPNDPHERYTYVYIPGKIKVEKARSKTCKPCMNFYCVEEK